MSFKIKELLQVIVESDLETDKKVDFLDKIYSTGVILDGILFNRK